MEIAVEKIPLEVDVDIESAHEPTQVYQTCSSTYVMYNYFYHDEHNDVDSYLRVRVLPLNRGHNRVHVLHLCYDVQLS